MKLFSSAAFEQRARDRERRGLVHELDRVPFVIARLTQLDRLDSEAALDATRAAARMPAPTTRPTNFVFCSGDINALRPMPGDRRFMVVQS